MDWAKTTARRDKNHLSFVIWCILCYNFYGNCSVTVALYSLVHYKIDARGSYFRVFVSPSNTDRFYAYAQVPVEQTWRIRVMYHMHPLTICNITTTIQKHIKTHVYILWDAGFLHRLIYPILFLSVAQVCPNALSSGQRFLRHHRLNFIPFSYDNVKGEMYHIKKAAL